MYKGFLKIHFNKKPARVNIGGFYIKDKNNKQFIFKWLNYKGKWNEETNTIDFILKDFDQESFYNKNGIKKIDIYNLFKSGKITEVIREAFLDDTDNYSIENYIEQFYIVESFSGKLVKEFDLNTNLKININVV